MEEAENDGLLLARLFPGNFLSARMSMLLPLLSIATSGFDRDLRCPAELRELLFLGVVDLSGFLETSDIDTEDGFLERL